MSSNIAFFIIATNSYTNYAKNAIISLDNAISDFSYEVILATDDPAYFEQLEIRGNLVICKIPSYGWPEVAMRRYEILIMLSENTVAPILFYLDADTQPFQITLGDFEGVLADKLMVFVLHPGFWRPIYEYSVLNIFFNFRIFLYFLVKDKQYFNFKGFGPKKFLPSPIKKYKLSRKSKGITDSLILVFKNIILITNWKKRGTWESNKQLEAFTPRLLRNRYVCGGIWFGERNAFLQFCITANDWVEKDLESGKYPVWFDESYANRYFASRFNSCFAGPDWAWTENYEHLIHIDPKIKLVDKASYNSSNPSSERG